MFVKCRSWNEKDDIDWFSMWTPLSLASVASVTFAGSSYTESVGFKAAQALFKDRLGVTIREIAPARTGQPTIAIHYFTRGHEGTTTFWGTSEGRLAIKKVCDYLGRTMPETAFWSANEVVQHLMEHRILGQMIKPMAMGLNKHRAATDCAFIFSGKATPSDKPLQDVFGLTDGGTLKSAHGWVRRPILGGLPAIRQRNRMSRSVDEGSMLRTCRDLSTSI